MPRASRLAALMFLLIFLPLAQSLAEESHPGMDIETQYAEAVLSFNGQRYDEALKTLNAILAKKPLHPESLELKALTLKAAGKEEKSLEVYHQLLKVKPAHEHAPYDFEIGSIYFKQKKYAQAKPYLEAAAAMNFNVAPTHFFLGLIAFQEGDMNAADRHFTEVTKAGVTDLEIAAHYYLGLTHFKVGYGSGATEEMLKAKNMAEKNPDSQIAKDIGAAASKTLAPYNEGQWFGNITLMQQYDGNVTLISPANTTPETKPGKESPKTTLMAGGGYMTSPMKKLQAVASYRFTGNYNWKERARGYDFASNVPSLYLTMNPLARTNYGVKIEGNYTFQNVVDSTGKGTYKPYNLALETGPYIRSEVARRLFITGQLFYKPQKFYQDDEGSDVNRRSGSGYFASVAAQKTTDYKLLNPSLLLSFEKVDAKGQNNVASTWTITLSDDFRFGASDTLTPSLSYAKTNYTETDPLREDKTTTARLSYIHSINTKWSVLADFTFTKNVSTIDVLYSYDKPVASIGLSYNL